MTVSVVADALRLTLSERLLGAKSVNQRSVGELVRLLLPNNKYYFIVLFALFWIHFETKMSLFLKKSKKNFVTL